MRDLFNWVEHIIELAAWASQSTTDILKQELNGELAGFTMSTAFSGIGAPETALHVMKKYLGIGASGGDALFAVEWDQECGRELAIMPGGPHCIRDIARLVIRLYWCKRRSRIRSRLCSI